MNSNSTINIQTLIATAACAWLANKDINVDHNTVEATIAGLVVIVSGIITHLHHKNNPPTK